MGLTASLPRMFPAFKIAALARERRHLDAQQPESLLSLPDPETLSVGAEAAWSPLGPEPGQAGGRCSPPTWVVSGNCPQLKPNLSQAPPPRAGVPDGV